MKKTEFCKQYNDECLKCPYSHIVRANPVEHHIICDFDLKTVRDNINHILKEKLKK